MKNATKRGQIPSSRENSDRSQTTQCLTDGKQDGSISPRAPRPAHRDLHEFFRRRSVHLEKHRQQLTQLVEDNKLVIPTHGIIDHARFSLLQPIVGLDREALANSGFTPAPMKLWAVRGPKGVISDAEADGAEILLRQSDGQRLSIWGDRVASVASLSRTLGLTNDRLHELSERDVVAAYHLITDEVLPWTTRVAQFSERSWAMSEIALTVDVLADSRTYANIYEKARWKHSRKPPRRFDRGLAWEGWSNRLTLYDKGWKMMMDGVEGGPLPGEIMRIERQWRYARGVATLAASIEHGHGPTLPMLVSGPNGGYVGLSRSIEHRVLHQVLARELADLDEPLPLLGSRIDAIALHMAECDRFYDLMQLHADRKTLKGYRGRMLGAILDREGLPSLLQLAYGERAMRVGG